MKKLLAGGLAALVTVGGAYAQTVPQVQGIGSTDLFQDIVGGAPQSGNFYASAPLLGNYSLTLGGNNFDNVLIGGDATTNLFQRATTGSSVTTTVTYGGPDRWAYWSGASTAITLSRDSTAADLSPSFQYAFKLARTSGQTGVVQVCMAQEVESSNSFQMANQAVELTWHVTAGANFSGTGVTGYIISGTSTDEGMQKLAWGLNAGGGGSTAWTGQANAAAQTITLAAGNTARMGVAGIIPTAAQEVGVAICWTPVGTAGTNDYLAISGIQLDRNSALTAAANVTNGVALLPGDARLKSYARRPYALEVELQQRYYYRLTETAAIFPVAPCAAVDTTHTNCFVSFPVTMRTAPTIALANGFASPTTTSQATLGACTTLTAATTVASTVGSTNGILVNCAATTIPAAGVASFLYSNNGTGTISANSEL